MIEKLDPRTLVTDCQIRDIEDPNYINELVRILEDAGTYTLPPIRGMRYDGAVHITDGYHRNAAACHACLEIIDVEIIDGSNRRDAITDAIAASRQNLSLRFDEVDKRNCLRIALETFPDYSTRRLADMIGIPHSTADRWRAKIEQKRQAEQAAKQKREQARKETAVLSATAATAPSGATEKTRVGRDGKEYQVKPTTIKCAQCGTMSELDFALNAPDSTWTDYDRHWYCSEDCKEAYKEDFDKTVKPRTLTLTRDMSPDLVAAHILRFFREGDDKSKPLAVARVLMHAIAPEELVEG